MALVRCFVVVAVSAVVVERLAFAWRLWLPVAAGRCRVVAGMVSALPPVVSALLVVANVPPGLKPAMVARGDGMVDLFVEALPHRLPWRLVAAQWQPWRLWRRLPLGFGSPAKSNCDLSPLTGGTTPPRRAQNHWVKAMSRAKSEPWIRHSWKT